MTDLTTKQISEINNINTHTQEMDLGNILQNLIDEVNDTTVEGTPVNAVNATKTLTISGVVTHGETVTINNPAVAGIDVYEFLADEAQTKSVATNIAVDITDYTSKSTGTLTLATQPTSGDTMTIGTKVYTFVPVGTATADGEISIGTDLASAKVNVRAAINGTDTFNEPHPDVTIGAFNVNNATITALIGADSEDAIATTETFTAVGNVFVAVTLESGADCLQANGVTALVQAITAHDTQGVGAADGAGDTVVLTADTAGVVGNAIIIGETMINGAFAGGAVLLSGGVNGSVGTFDQTLMDASYIYKCVADNTTSGKNWRRISLGTAY